MRAWLVVLSSFATLPAHADDAVPQIAAPSRGLLDEVMLHPLDGFTADTLPAGTIIYNQSPLTLPLPSWAWIGVTDWLTAEVDMLPLLGGLTVEPYAPVPSFNLRARLFPGLAVEAMVQHLWRPLDQENGPFRITRDGTHAWARLTASLPVARGLRVHASAGASWTEDITYAREGMPDAVHRDMWSPDASLAIDWRAHRRWSFHATGSYGTTFVYSDNQPRKWQLAYGFRVAPFLDHGWAILRTLRIEAAAIVSHYRDLHTGYRLYVPLLPYLYWQFRAW